MGWEPITYCRECNTPFDAFVAREERICEGCAELSALEWVCPINYPGCVKNCGNYGCGN